jgi:hypothetical protein
MINEEVRMNASIKRAGLSVATLAALACFCASEALGGTIVTTVWSSFTDTGTNIIFSGVVQGTLTSSQIQFATDTGYNWHPFSISFASDSLGTLIVPSSGTYTFQLNSDDGSYLFIDGSLVVNNGGNHFPQVMNGSAFLTPGMHPFEVQFQENGFVDSGVDLNLPTGVSFGPASIPEPGTMMMGGMAALLGLVLSALRRPTQG